MKHLAKLKIILTVILLVLIVSCRSGRPRTSNTGFASDRTGTNGATNGNGKAPSTTAHKVRY